MAACANHALWIETLKRSERIKRQHDPYQENKCACKEPVWMRQVQRRRHCGDQTSLKPCTYTLRRSLPFGPQKRAKQTLPACKDCETDIKFFCYVCCKCGCRPAPLMDNKLKGPRGDGLYKGKCPNSSTSKKCPESCDPPCACGCRERVSLDARPIVIPILSCVICFPVFAFAIICALKYRAERLRRKDQMKRVQTGCRSVTLEIPGKDKSSFYSKDSSSDPSLKGLAEISQAVPDSPPLLSAPSTSGMSSRRSSRVSQHVKFMTTTAVLHGRTITGLNGRFKSTGKSQKIFWDEHSSHVDCALELEKELSLTLNS